MGPEIQKEEKRRNNNNNINPNEDNKEPAILTPPNIQDKDISVDDNNDFDIGDGNNYNNNNNESENDNKDDTTTHFYNQPTIIKSINDFSQFRDTMKKPKRGMEHIALIFEEPKRTNTIKCNSLIGEDKNNKRIERWRNYVSTLHVVMSPPEQQPKKMQMYVVRTAAVPHYQEGLEEILLAAQRFMTYNPESNLCLNIYHPRFNYCNNFIIIHNQQVETLAEWPQMDLEVPSFTEKWKNDKNDRKRNTNYATSGFTPNESTSRKLSESGHSKPYKKESCDEPFIQNFLLCVTKASDQLLPPWLSPGEKLFRHPNQPNRPEEFANRIATGNIMEACAFSINHDKDLLKIHYDMNQPTDLYHSALVGVNVLYDNQRFAGVAYQRASIHTYLNMQNKCAKIMNFLDRAMDQIGEKRRKISNLLRNGNRVEVLPGYQLTSNKCNMETDGFHNIFLYYCLLMSTSFKLPLPELLAIHSASQMIPNSPAFFAMACHLVLHHTGKCKGQALDLCPSV